MKKHQRRILSLDNGFAKALKVFNKTMEQLEQNKKDYEELKAEIQVEIQELEQETSNINTMIDKNEKLLSNFKKLLG